MRLPEKKTMAILTGRRDVVKVSVFSDEKPENQIIEIRRSIK